MIALFLHNDAVSDLRDLKIIQPEAAARILALLQELKGNPDLLDRLTQHGYGSRNCSDFNVSKWLAHWKRGRDLWRLKVWDLEDKGLRYRIIYAFVPQKKHHYILAIAPREFNYDTNHPISRRIIRAYEEL